MRGFLIKVLIPLLGMVSCASHQPTGNTDNMPGNGGVAPVPQTDTFPTGKLIQHIISRNDSTQSYALYIPFKKNHQALPVIYFFDPHADGSLPLDKYKLLAEKYGFILIGSNNSKNGNDYPTTENIWQHLFADTRSRINIDVSRISVCGFSGGAKAAGYIALNHAEIKSVIANSAALPEETALQNFSFSFTGIAGDGDMNLTNVVSFCNELDKTSTKHRLILFKGKHEWAPVATMNIAFEGLIMDAMRNKLLAVDSNFLNSYISENKKGIENLISANNFIRADDACRLSVSMLEGLTTSVSFFIQKQASIASNPLYQQQLKHFRELFAAEENMKDHYQQQFQAADINYWQKTIAALEQKAKATTDEGAMYNRLLAYLSLAFYSFSNRLIQSNQNDAAEYFVTLYKMADPGNSEAWYFSAIVNARKSNGKVAEEDLLKAVSSGFNDKERLRRQPEFQMLHLDFSAIESKMKNQ